jgi:hypothetical protein
MDPAKKPPHKVVTFDDAQAAIDGTLEAWLPRLVESNDALEQALLLLRDLHFAGQGTLQQAHICRQTIKFGRTM